MKRYRSVKSRLLTAALPAGFTKPVEPNQHICGRDFTDVQQYTNKVFIGKLEGNKIIVEQLTQSHDFKFDIDVYGLDGFHVVTILEKCDTVEDAIKLAIQQAKL